MIEVKIKTFEYRGAITECGKLRNGQLFIDILANELDIPQTLLCTQRIHTELKKTIGTDIKIAINAQVVQTKESEWSANGCFPVITKCYVIERPFHEVARDNLKNLLAEGFWDKS